MQKEGRQDFHCTDRSKHGEPYHLRQKQLQAVYLSGLKANPKSEEGIRIRHENRQ
jgi:hypothetical protein